MTVAGDVSLPNEWRIERSIAAIEQEWRTLEARAVSTPFQSYEWMSSLLKEPGIAEKAVFALGSRDGKLVALFPLSLSHGTLSWLNDKWSNYNQPLIAKELFTALDVEKVDKMWRDIRAALGNPSATILRRQLAEIDGRPNPFAQWAAIHEPTYTYALNLGDDWGSFYAARNSPSSRKGLERKLKKLEKEGNTVWTRIEGAQAIREHMETMLLWKSQQLDAQKRRNPFSDPASRTLFANFAAEHPEKIRIYAARHDGKPIAINFLLEGDRRLVIYQMAYDSGLSKFSPGRLLLNHILQEVIAERHVQLDFSVGDDPYKRELCDQIGKLSNSVKAHSILGLPAALKARALIFAKSVIKADKEPVPASPASGDSDEAQRP